MLTWPSGAINSGDGVGVWIAAVLTLAILSAALGETRVSRMAFALLIGGAVGYVAVVTWQAVLWPRALLVWRSPGQHWSLLLWFVLGLLLLARGLTSASWLSNLSLAYLIGVGVALAIGGAVLGTAVPQLMAVAAERGRIVPGSWLAIVNTALIAVGTGGVLFRFTYTGLGGEGRPARLWTGLVRRWGQVGYAFIMVAFGALFATAIVSLLAVLTSRLQFLLVDWLRVVAR